MVSLWRWRGGSIINNGDNFFIGIDVVDDDDDNSNDIKKQRIGKLLNESRMLEDGSFPTSKENLLDMMTPRDLPPRIKFQFLILCLLSQSLIPRQIYSEVVCMIN